jgi:two-component system, cell cycle response regulator
MSEHLKRELEKLKVENQKLKSELIRDDLTGLFNARHLREQLEKVLSERHQAGAEPALLFLDVDRFKEVNEVHGHQAAGRVLNELGFVISQSVRVDDVAFRYGGDEFVILVSGGLAGAKLVGERIRKRIESHTFRVLGLKGSAKVQITVSLGLCVMSKGATVESVLNQADQAMFEAKRGSRNALVVA